MTRSKFVLSEQEKAFIKSNDFSNLRFGYELETQSFLGCTMSNMHDMIDDLKSRSSINKKAMHEIVESKWESSQEDSNLTTQLLNSFNFYGGTCQRLSTESGNKAEFFMTPSIRLFWNCFEKPCEMPGMDMWM